MSIIINEKKEKQLVLKEYKKYLHEFNINKEIDCNDVKFISENKPRYDFMKWFPTHIDGTMVEKQIIEERKRFYEIDNTIYCVVIILIKNKQITEIHFNDFK